MDLALGTDNDVLVTGGDLVLLRGLDAIAQHMKVRFRFFQGESFADARVGMPYFQKILGKQSSIEVIRRIFRKATAETPGISSVLSLDLTYTGSTRTLNVSVKAVALDGEPLNFDSEFIL